MKRNRMVDRLKVYTLYTLFFCITAAGIFALFFINNKTFIYDGDASDQGFFWTIEMKNSIESLMDGNGYPLWSWYRGMGLDAKPPIDIFMVIASLFPLEHMELGYTVAILLRLYFAGFAFVMFAREVELDGFRAVTGALMYVFTTWTINLALMQGQYINIFILFPLLVLATDRIYKGKSPIPFILIVGITVAVNFYLAYMSAICIIIYIFLRYFRYHNFSAGKYFGFIWRFILYGTAGILVSAVFVLATLQMIAGASTGSKPDISLLYDTAYYYQTGIRLISYGYAVSYTYIGIPVFALITIFAGRKPSIRATHGIMAVITFLMTLFPFFGSMFNGFGYVSNRWYFLLIFFLVWTACEHIDLDRLAGWKNLIVMFLTWAALGITTLGFSYYDITGDLGMNKALFIAGNLAAGFGMIIIIALGRKVIKPLRVRQALILLAVMGSLILTWNISLRTHMDYFYDDGKISGQLAASTQRAGSQIEDDGFYRIDQTDWINFSCKADQPANENLYWQNNTIYLYDSKIPSRLSLFNKYLGNNLGYSKRVYVQSNGNRMGLDFLEGVKYFLGNDPSHDKTDSSDYAGYAFEPYDTIDGVEVFKSRYDPGIGFTYDAYITESEFLKLGRLEREQAILQAIVIPDEKTDRVAQMKELKAEDIDLDIKDIGYTVNSEEGLALEGNTITAEEEDSVLSLHVENVPASQLVVSFDGLRRYNDSGRETGDFYIFCSNSKLTFGISNSKNNQTIPDISDFDFNMGYYDSYTGNLRIHFKKPGTYKFDRLYVSAMSVDNFDKYASNREAGSFRAENISWSEVSGICDAPDDGLLFISIPAYSNWDIYIDGTKADRITNANITFLAAPIAEGRHEVVLKYNIRSRVMALGITCAGLLLALLSGIIGRKRRRSIREELERASVDAVYEGRH